MLKRIGALTVAAILVIGSAGIARADATGGFHGFVVGDDDGRAVGGATVVASGLYGEFETTSRPDGSYTFLTLPAGIYQIWAYRTGYGSHGCAPPLIVDPGRVMYLNLSLARARVMDHCRFRYPSTTVDSDQTADVYGIR